MSIVKGSNIGKEILNHLLNGVIIHDDHVYYQDTNPDQLILADLTELYGDKIPAEKEVIKLIHSASKQNAKSHKNHGGAKWQRKKK